MPLNIEAKPNLATLNQPSVLYLHDGLWVNYTRPSD